MVNFLKSLVSRHHGIPAAGRAAPDFTIIIPVRNPGAKLAASLASILLQPDVTVEVIVAEYDHCAAAQEAIASYPGQLKHIRMEEPGVYTAMNAAIRQSCGRILYFLGAGDRLRQNVLSAIKAATDWSTTVMLYGNVYMEDLKITYDGQFDAKKLRKMNICHQAIFYSRAVFRKHGYYDVKYPLLADYAYNIMLFGDAAVQKHYVEETLADYEGGGLSANGHDAAFKQDRAAMNQRYLSS